jgi:hypothetical protein
MAIKELEYTTNKDLGTIDDVFQDTKAVTSIVNNDTRLVTTLNTNATEGDILDYVTKTTIQTPTPALDLGELGRILVIKKVDIVTNADIQIITDPLTTLDNLSLAFKYGLNRIYYLEQTELDLSIENINNYFSIVLSGFTIDSATFDGGLFKGVIYINQDTITENPLANQDKIAITYQSTSALSIINATLYAVNISSNNYADLQYVEITDAVEVPKNIGEAELLKSFNINFVYYSEKYGRRLALSRIGGRSGYIPYLEYKIVKEIKYNNFTFATTKKPYNNETLKTILKNKQEIFLKDNYGEILNSGSFQIANTNTGFQTWDCNCKIDLPDSIWFFNLIVEIGA